MAISSSSFSHPPDAERLKRALKATRFAPRADAPPPASAHARDLDAARFQLALRGWVDPQRFLPTAPDSVTRTTLLDTLATDCETSTAQQSRWTLKDPVRRCTLKSHSAEDVARALEAIPPGERDAITRVLHMLYVGPVPELATLSSEELRALSAAAEWTLGHAVHAVDIIEVRRCAARAARDEQYKRTVAGGFFGRREELEQLRTFLTAPANPGAATLRAAWIWGAGGIGKSTLIAATALAVLREVPHAAVAHLDFDRSDLDPTRSVSLDLEVLRQVGGADPAVERDLAALRERIREQLSDDLALGFDISRQQVSAESTFSDAKSVFSGALDWLRSRNQPLILILDTCEQLQAGGPDYWEAFQRWLSHLSVSSGAPEVRALLCGRTDPARWSPGVPVDFTHELTDLDHRDSVALLAHRGVPGPLAEAAAETFGGNPLMLQLVANLVAKAGEQGIQEIAAATRDGMFPPALVQGLLYDRFLKHIDDPDARRYAHPGLILPTVTPALIQHVIAPVLGDNGMTEARAHAIFDALRAATWLTEEADDGRAITQRPDIRSLMLRLMRSDTPHSQQADDLRAAAIAYHSERQTDRDRAFALYHRLMTVTDVNDLAQFDEANIAEAMRYLRRYMDDFPAHVQSYLQARSLTHLGPDEALKSLSDKAWETYLLGEGTEAGYGEQAARAGDPMIPLNLWRRRPVGTPSRPPTFVLQALCETADWDAALDLEGALDELEGADADAIMQRLQVLTRFRLMQHPGALSPRHQQLLSQTVGAPRAGATRIHGLNELCAIAAVAEGFMRQPLVPLPQFANRALSSEVRLRLVRLQTAPTEFEWQPHLDALTTFQRDWDVPAGRVLNEATVAIAREALASVDGAPLDSVASVLQTLRQPVPVRVTAASPDPATRVALLRGTTPEFHRPVRQALREAFPTADEIRPFIASLRSHLSICPRDLEPDVFADRAARDPVNLFLSLAQFADRARVLGSLLDLAHTMAPGATKLARVRSAWHAWDTALTGGDSSDWTSTAHHRRTATESASRAGIFGRAEVTAVRSPLSSSLHAGSNRWDMPVYDFNYHSGTEQTFIGPRVTPAAEAFVAAPQALRKIAFKTDRYAPNHVVTIRSSTEGWTADTFGTYRDGAWEFFFEIPSLPPTLVFKFVLDGEHWMDGPDLSVPTNMDHAFDDSGIHFPAASTRFHHGYDNFHIDRTKLAQDAVPRNTREDIHYDVIIIGSGMGGGPLADALSDAGLKVLVLEAGGLTLPTHMTNLPGDWSRTANHHRVGHFVNEPGSDFLPGVHLCLGGRSVYWSGLIPRMHDWELSSWPHPVQTFLQGGGYEAAEALLRKTRRLGTFQDSVVARLKAHLPEWHVEDLPRSVHQPFLNAAGELDNIVQESTGIFSTADLLLASLGYSSRAGRQNLTINLGHLVTRILTEGTKATAVECQDLLGNTTRRYRAHIIVLAAGSLESPRIAINSGLHDPAGKLGVGLTDHPAFFSATYHIPDQSMFGGSKRHAKVFLHKKAATASDHPFNVEVIVNPELWHVRNSDDDLVPVPNPSKIKMTFTFASHLDDANRVTSSGVGTKLSVNVRRNNAGVQHFDAARTTRNAILASLDVPFTADEGMAYGNEGTVHHAGGTMRMSGNSTGVVDTNLKFEAYDNLYCVDPSVWPSIPAANPALTLVALSLRLATHLTTH